MSAALLPPKAVRLLELVAQPRRAQIFAQMGQPLLQREASSPARPRYWSKQCRATSSKGSRPAASSRAARVRPRLSTPARRPLLLASSALSAVATNCGRWLTHATSSSWRAGSRSRVFEPMAATHSRQPFTNSAECGERCQVGIVGKEPDRAAKKLRIAQRRAAPLLARHGMAGQETPRAPAC